MPGDLLERPENAQENQDKIGERKTAITTHTHQGSNMHSMVAHPASRSSSGYRRQGRRDNRSNLATLELS